MGRLRGKAAESQYKEYNRLMTEQFNNELNDDEMVDEILKEVTTIEDIEDALHVHVLLCVHRVEVQRVQKSALHEIRGERH